MRLKTLGLFCAILTVCEFMLTGCSGGSSAIGKEKALAIALADAGFAESEVRDIDVELERRLLGGDKYEVSFEAGWDEYEYVLAADDGEILKSKKD